MGRNGEGMRGCKSVLAARVSINGVSTVPSVPSISVVWVNCNGGSSVVCRTGEEKKKKRGRIQFSEKSEIIKRPREKKKKNRTRLKLAAKII